MLNKINNFNLEKYSSAITLSDMEIFIFPELMFALVLANIMSPIIWEWKKNLWFKNIDKLNVNKKIQRIKQYIMNNYTFNLDLDTWGLTKKDKEISRFKDFINLKTLSQSNALFGYEGEKYYFNIDIRRHFGLCKYTSDIIPYWKTETIEAMNAFVKKKGYLKGAGECVSFSALYYSALFIIAKIPLENIFMIATPLHSQNFININKGIITNNRRIITQNMWFNGTEISTKARRAIDNEKITFVINNEGYVHKIYNEATMPKKSFENFSNEFSKYLETKIDSNLIKNFLRYMVYRQVCFQFEHYMAGKKFYIEAEKVFPYEHGSPYLIGTNTEKNLLNEIDPIEYYTKPIKGRINFEEIEELFNKTKYTITEFLKQPKLLNSLTKNKCKKINGILKELLLFCKSVPNLPSKDKKYIKTNVINLKELKTRDEIIKYLLSQKEINETIKLAFIAYRDFNNSNILFFLKAAIERNPIIIKNTKNMSFKKIFEKLNSINKDSIYSENRLAQPDEVWNFSTGDGLEKAIALFSIAINRGCDSSINKEKNKKKVFVKIEEKEYIFISNKNIKIEKKNYISFLR